MSSKPKKTAKKAAKKSGSRGKRYTPAQKKEVIDFVNEVNAAKGRGGQSSASKKFGISPLTISSWLKAGGSAPKKPGRRPGRPAGSKAKAKTKASAGGSLEKKLVELQSLAKQIDAAESNLSSLRKKFDSLKASL
ncbi:hypothetical protein [Haloferula sp. A504]|uniref:hypothetical protein n=1 Tax=Haloferula sp. A504 TaxID=3373601 RepID=UPI0031C68FD3|nr:hypothetical protein [Verrucomicrobiaceae bacterium E54]